MVSWLRIPKEFLVFMLKPFSFQNIPFAFLLQKPVQPINFYLHYLCLRCLEWFPFPWLVPAPIDILIS